MNHGGQGESRSRRTSRCVLAAVTAALFVAGLNLAGSRLAGSAFGGLALARQVSDPADCQGKVLTPAQTEGPYYRPNAPERASLLEPGVAGTPVVVTGRVLTTECQPVAGAWLDFWQADGRGAYDNRGFLLRGHQYTDLGGQYWLETVVPGEYPGRAPHIHVKVQTPGGPVLTTQLYFPDAAGNARDGIFDPALLMSVQESSGTFFGRFDFVVRVSE